MKGKGKHIELILILLLLLNLNLRSVYCQHVSRNNYYGYWETPSSWSPVWSNPQKTIIGYDITINGYITANGSLNFTGSANNLIVNDTLVIIGDLTVNNNNQVIVNDNGILIIRGNFIMENQSSVTANGYFVITGNYIKTSAIGQGSFNSNKTPAKIFIGGSLTPASIVNDRPNYQALDCSTPVAPYSGSFCTYGNLTDLGNDPLYSFYQSTCGGITASGTTPVCEGSSVALSVTDGTSYSWTGPNSFTSSLQNPVISNATPLMSGTYSVIVTSPGNCSSSSSVGIIVNQQPSLVINNPPAVCFSQTVDITAASVTAGSTAGLVFTYWTDAAATTSYPTPSSASAGTYYIKGTLPSTGCFTTKPVTVTVNPIPVLLVNTPPSVCSPSTVDLTKPSVTSGSTEGLVYTYWTDAAATSSYPTVLSASAGTYYIKGTLPSTGCFDIKPVTVTVNPIPVLVVSNPPAVCSPSTLDITVSSVTSGSTAELVYTYWIDAAATTSYPTASSASAGTYYIKGTLPSTGCYDIKPVTVTVNPTPVLVVTNPSAVCSPSTVDLTNPSVTSGSTAGLVYTYWADAAATSSYPTASCASAGTYYIKGAVSSSGCYDIKSVTVTVDAIPYADAGPDQVLEYTFETSMEAELPPRQNGEWSLESGSGVIENLNSPVTRISSLRTGENIFKWTVNSGACKASDNVKVKVNDLIIPTVITPNGDGKNDYFRINYQNERIELVVYNRWGSLVYNNSNYRNDWDGKNNKGEDMVEDTYYIVLSFEKGMIRKGSVQIIR